MLSQSHQTWDVLVDWDNQTHENIQNLEKGFGLWFGGGGIYFILTAREHCNLVKGEACMKRVFNITVVFVTKNTCFIQTSEDGFHGPIQFYSYNGHNVVRLSD